MFSEPPLAIGRRMERMTSWTRPTGMVNHHRIGGLAAAGLLCAALAGCGAAVASTSSPAANSPAPGRAMQTPVPETGCASVNQATKVTIQQRLHLVESVNVGMRTVTQGHAALVSALLRDICAALANPATRSPGFLCAAQSGKAYAGTFYDGKRILATFTYSRLGCPLLSLTAAGKTRATVLLGKAAAAAPHFKADLAAVLGVPESQVLRVA